VPGIFDRFPDFSDLILTPDNREISFSYLVEGYNFELSLDESVRETWKLYCDWEDSWDLADSLLGSAYWDQSGSLVRRLPRSLYSLALYQQEWSDDRQVTAQFSKAGTILPEIPQTAPAYVVEVVIDPIKPTGSEDGLGDFYKAFLTTTSTVLPYSVLPDDVLRRFYGLSASEPKTDVYYDSATNTTSILRYISRGANRADRFLSIKPGLLRYQDDNSLCMNTFDWKQGGTELQYVWHQVPSRLVEGGHLANYWLRFLGKTNSDFFDGYPPESLWLTGVNIQLGRFFNGQPYVDVRLQMRHQDVAMAWGKNWWTNPPEVAGHNHFIHVDQDGKLQCQKVTTTGLATGAPLIRSVRFYDFFYPSDAGGLT